MISHYEILQFWKDKVITKDYEVKSINDIEVKDLENKFVVFDCGEPECWGCGKPVYGIEDILLNNKSTLINIWNNDIVRGYLHKCHIFAKQFGGKESPNNLFLLCKECHKESPDTVNPKNFFCWVWNKRNNGGYIGEFAKGIEDTAKYMKIDLNYLASKFNENYSWNDITIVIKNAIKKSGMHGFEISKSTYYYCILDELKKFIENE